MTWTRRDFLVAAGCAALGATPPSSLGLAAGLPTGGMDSFDVLVRQGRLVDPAQGLSAIGDLGIKDGRIARIAETLPQGEATRVVDASGRIVTPGLIDSHVHVYDGVSSVAIQPDVVGVARGVTTLVDAGSAGSTTFPGFRRYVVPQARTRVFALLNVSRPGLTLSNELADLSYVDVGAAVQTIVQNRDIVVGIKVRMLDGIPDGADVEVMQRSREIGDQAGVPLMVHIGGQSSPLPRILDFLRPGDVVTHAMRQRGSILDANGRIHPEVFELVRNGVYLDVGHGRGNLDFDVAEAVLDQGLLPDVISSDVHRGNVAGPVFDLPTTLSKFMQLGMTLEQVIKCATEVPARIFDFRASLGTLREGVPADISIFDMVDGLHEFEDSGGKRRTGEVRLVPYLAFRDGHPLGQADR